MGYVTTVHEEIAGYGDDDEDEEPDTAPTGDQDGPGPDAA